MNKMRQSKIPSINNAKRNSKAKKADKNGDDGDVLTKNRSLSRQSSIIKNTAKVDNNPIKIAKKRNQKALNKTIKTISKATKKTGKRRSSIQFLEDDQFFRNSSNDMMSLVNGQK